MGFLLAFISVLSCAEPTSSEYEKKLAVLEKVESNSKDLPRAFEKAAILFYKNQKWDRFFGTARTARKFLKPSSQLEKIELLEVLALLRHCQWKAAQEKAEEALSRSEPLSQDAKTLYLLLVGDEVTVPQEGVLEKNSPEPFSTKRFHWPLPTSQLKQLKPLTLRKKVTSLCGDSE